MLKTALHLALASTFVVVTGCGSTSNRSTSSSKSSSKSVEQAVFAATRQLPEHDPFAFPRMPRDHSQPIVAAANPEAVTHCLHGNHVVLGYSVDGGGYINFAHYRKNAKSVRCEDVRAGLIKNEANVGFGRGWQSALRDRLHSGRYNPTQAGFMDGAGRRITRVNGSTKNYPGIGQVRRIEIPTFNLPLFSDPVYDFTQFEDLYPDYNNEPAVPVRDNDGIAVPKNGGRDGIDQNDEVRSEFDYTGAMEVWSDAVGVAEVDVFRHTFGYTYQREPDAIFQFGKNGVLDSGLSVIDEADRLNSLSDVVDAGKPRDTDLSAGIIAYGIRFNRTAKFMRVLSIGPNGKLRNAKVTRKGAAFHVPGGGDSNEDPKLHAGIVGGKNLPNAYEGVAMLCNCDERGKKRAWAIYAPPHSVTNSRQIVGQGGGKRYTDDRRFQTVISASLNGEGPGSYDVEGGKIEAQLTKLEVKTFFKGLYAPGRTHKGTRESIRQEVFILHGDPDDIVRAVKKIADLIK